MTINEIECAVCLDLPVYVGRLNCKEKHSLCNECAKKVFDKFKEEKKEVGECPTCRGRVTKWKFDREQTMLVRQINGDVDQHEPLEVKAISLAKKVDTLPQTEKPPKKDPRFDPPEKTKNPTQINEARMKNIEEKFRSFRLSNNSALDKFTITELVAGLETTTTALCKHFGQQLSAMRAYFIAMLLNFPDNESSEIKSARTNAGTKLFQMIIEKKITYGYIKSELELFDNFNSFRTEMRDTFCYGIK